jgi:hypothetical protein
VSWEPGSDITTYRLAPKWYDLVYPALEATEADPPEVWRDIEADASRFIYKAVSFLQHAGVEVDPHAFHLPDTVVGRVHYEPVTKIEINVGNAQIALLTAMHEIGHLLSYWRLRRQMPDGPEDRETLAYLYGWVAIRLLGVEGISKEEWGQFHEENP